MADYHIPLTIGIPKDYEKLASNLRGKIVAVIADVLNREAEHVQIAVNTDGCTSPFNSYTEVGATTVITIQLGGDLKALSRRNADLVSKIKDCIKAFKFTSKRSDVRVVDETVCCRCNRVLYDGDGDETVVEELCEMCKKISRDTSIDSGVWSLTSQSPSISCELTMD